MKIEPDEILVAIKRPEGYEAVHPELMMEDLVRRDIEPPWKWRIIEQTPCNGDLRTHLVGDGCCEMCNPELDLDHAREEIAELESLVALLTTALKDIISSTVDSGVWGAEPRWIAKEALAKAKERQ